MIVHTHTAMKMQMGNWPDFSLTITLFFVCTSVSSVILKHCQCYPYVEQFSFEPRPLAQPLIFIIIYLWETPVDLWGLKGTSCSGSYALHTVKHARLKPAVLDTARVTLGVKCSPCFACAGQ